MTVTNSSSDVVILGGGLAGLAASVMTGAPVYEAADAIGGVASSDSVKAFTFDRGIHVLQTKNQRVLDLLAEVGMTFATRERIAHIYAHGQYSEYPFQVNSAGLPVALRARCVWEFLRRNGNPEPRNYQDWIYRSVGKGFADTFLIPYSEKFWCVSPKEMTFEWTGNNRVPQPRLSQVLRGAIYNKRTSIGNAIFRYPEPGPGYGAVARALAKRCGAIRLGHHATRLDAGMRRIVFNDNSAVNYQVLINTIPLPELVSIAFEAPEAVRAAVARLRTNSILVVNLGINRPNLSEKHWVHFPEKHLSFFRISFLTNFANDMAPPGTSSISCEVSYRNAQPLDSQATTRRVIDDLIRIGILRREDEILATSTYDIRYAYCIYDMERKAALRTVKAWLASVDIVPAGRYGLWTYFWSDEAIMSGLKAGERSLRWLAGERAA
jgi:protoporphyrinogen oxidase